MSSQAQIKAAAPEQTVPVVDLHDFTRGTPAQRDAFVQTVGDALFDIGFFALVNHGVDHARIRDAYRLLEDVFVRPADEKAAWEDPALKGQRGFTSFGREKARDHDMPDLKEFWQVGQEFGDDSPIAALLPRNVWPAGLPGFKQTMLSMYAELEACSQHLLEACALYIDEPRRLLADQCVGGDTILRLIHYPPVPDDAEPKAVRAAAHEDINHLTLLCEATSGGLELLQRDGTWRKVHALHGQLVVDSGDMLQMLTNGVYKATTHRVVNPDNTRDRRFSMPFFVHPRPDVDLTPLPSCVERRGGEVHFPSMTAGEYLQQRLREIGLA